ncbi:MAG: diguanylate cyclase [Cyclobacteriaceae bacterium]|nr:diguanylate cyclase [Cyclobacteriaceae bacterium]
MLDKKTILIIDDESSQLELLEKMLVEYNVFSGETSDQMWECIHKNSIDLILLDVIMPNEDGFQIAQALRKNEITKDIPILFISARIEGQDIVKGFDAGGVDYIKKPYDTLELKARIAAALKQKENELYLKKQSMMDPLTNTYNRQYFTDSVKAILDKNSRKDNNIVVATLDIDFFKKVNDTYGHDVGDVAIQEIANILNKNLRESDLMARFGGEEFCILLENITQNDAAILFEKIRIAFENNIIEIDNLKIKFTVSIGICYGIGFTLEDMIKNSDEGLYYCKNNGRNQIAINK